MNDNDMHPSLPYEMCEEVLLFAANLLLALTQERELRDPNGRARQALSPVDTDSDALLANLLAAQPPSRRLLRSLCPHLSWFTASHALSACNLRLFELLIEAKYFPKNHRRSLEWAFVHGDLATLDHLRLTVHAADPAWHVPPELVWLTCLCPEQAKAVDTLNWWIQYAPRKTQLVNLRHASSPGRLRDVSEIPTNGTHMMEMYLKDWFLKSGLYPHHMYQCVTRPCSAMGAVDLLRWWKAHGAEKMGMACQGSELDVASAHGHVDVLRWWSATGWELRWTEAAMDLAAVNGFVHVLVWWVKESGLRPLRYTERMWEAAEKHAPLGEWLRNESGLPRKPVEPLGGVKTRPRASSDWAHGRTASTVSFECPAIASCGSARPTSAARSKSPSPSRVRWDGNVINALNKVE